MAIDFYFVCVSPWAFIGIDKLNELSISYGRSINFKPIDLISLWKEAGAGKPLKDRPAVLKDYRLIELRRWTEWRKKSMNINPKHFPVPFNPSSRAIIAALQSDLDGYKITRAIMSGCWVEDKNISNPDDLKSIISGIGMDAQHILEHSNSNEVTEEMERNTQEALSRGLWSVPSYVVDQEIFYGQDRLEMIDWILSNNN